MNAIKRFIARQFYIELQYPSGSGIRYLRYFPSRLDRMVWNKKRSCFEYKNVRTILTWKEGKLKWFENFLDWMGIVREW